MKASMVYTRVIYHECRQGLFMKGSYHECRQERVVVYLHGCMFLLSTLFSDANQRMCIDQSVGDQAGRSGGG